MYVEDVPLGERHERVGRELGGGLVIGHLDDDGWGPVFAVLELRPGGPVDLELERLVELAETASREADDPAAIVATWRRVLDHDPAHALAYHRLEEVLEQEEDWSELVELLRERTTHQPEAARALALQIAAILEHDIEDHEGAVETYEGLLGADPHDADALAALARLYAAADDWSSVLEIERTRLEVLTAPHHRAECLLRIARVARDQLGRGDEAVTTLREVVALVPDHARAMDELAELYTAREDWWSLVEVLSARALLPGAGSGGIQMRLAGIMETQIGDAEQAIRLYESALEAGGDAPTALAALERLYVERDAWADVLRTYERQLELATSDATKMDLLARLALVREEAMGDLTAAMVAWDRLLEISPGHAEAFAALQRLQGLADSE